MVSLPENTTDNTTQNSDNSQQQDSQYKLISRVVAYPSVTAVLETAKVYYETAKDRSAFVKKAAENVESNIDSTMKYIVQPVLSNERVGNVLSSVDNIGCKQLDKLEKVAETYTPTMIAIKDKAVVMVEQSVQRIEPIDQYLKDSYLAAPLTIAVSQIEKSFDKYMPEEKIEEKNTVEQQEQQEEEDVDNSSTEEETTTTTVPYEAGPIFRSGKLAKRLQKNALAKLNNLSLRDSNTTSGYLYVVDLIQYAAKNLDTTVETTSKFVNHSIEKSKENFNEAKKVISDKANSAQPILDSTKSQIESLTHEAVHAIMTAIDVLSKNVPTPISSTGTKIIDKTKEFANSLETANIQLYSTVALKSAEKLRETSAMISSSLNNPEGIPAHLIESIKTTLSGILDGLMSRDYSSITNTINSFMPSTPHLIKLN